MQVEVLQFSPQEIRERLERMRSRLDPLEYQWWEAFTLGHQKLYELFGGKSQSLKNLQRLMFGRRTERKRRKRGCPPVAPKSRRPGHGRNGADQYPGAERVKVRHERLRSGEPCPDCPTGKLYDTRRPRLLLKIIAQPIFPAKVYELEKLRCNACGKLFEPRMPLEAGSQKYDPSVGCMLGLLRFGYGCPHYRLESMQANLGVPLPAGTQWGLMGEAAGALEPVVKALTEVAAQGDLIHTDDTSMLVQSLVQEFAPEKAQDPKERTGVFTTGMVARVGEHKVVLYRTGHAHAGENLDAVLTHRDRSLSAPLQMSDGLSRNKPKKAATVLSNCLAHGRRQLFEVKENFPQQCEYALGKLGEVYHHDAQARDQGLSAGDRLVLHQEKSGPVMEELKEWMQREQKEKRVEPNSGLGKAFNYLLKRWEALTQFLRIPGAPLDNNECERALKRAILHRKNSLSYRTEKGAAVGDAFMTVIATCRENGVDAFAYLKTLQRYPDMVRENPKQWLPWNYTETLQTLDSS